MRNRIVGIIFCISLILAAAVAAFVVNDNEFYHQYKEENAIVNKESLNIDISTWNIKYTSTDDYLLNEYFFMNLAGDILNCSPKTVYFIDNDSIELCFQQPIDSIFPNYKYVLKIIPQLSDPNDSALLDENIVSFVDYNYLTSNKRDIKILSSNDYSPLEIKNSLSYFEKCIYSSDFDSKTYGHESFVSEINFVDYFLIYELAYSGYYSVDDFTLYLNDNNKFCLVPSTFEGSGSYNGENYHNLISSSWFNMMLKSEKFTSDILKEYRYLRNTLISDEYVSNELDQIVEFMLKNKNVNTDEIIKQRDELKNYLLYRLNWLDNNIDSLREFSSLSAVKEYNLSPY